MSVSTESEIKLRVPPPDLSKVHQHPLVSKWAQQGPVEKHLQSIYFDTSDLQLLEQGVGLRVRRVDNHWIQTLKGGGSGNAGLHRRQEWESEVETSAPALDRLAAEAKVGVLKEPDLQTRLIPVFETDFWRTVWVLQVTRGSVIELALDQGHIRSSGRRESLSELELELKQGREKDLYTVALQLAEVFPLVVEHASKAERGYRLYTQQFSPLKVPGPVPPDRAPRSQLLEYWLVRLQYGERLLLERGDSQGRAHLRVAAEKLHQCLTAAEAGLDALLEEDLDWLVDGVRESKDFAETCRLVTAPRYSQLLLRLGAYLAEWEGGQ